MENTLWEIRGCGFAYPLMLQTARGTGLLTTVGNVFNKYAQKFPLVVGVVTTVAKVSGVAAHNCRKSQCMQS